MTLTYPIRLIRCTLRRTPAGFGLPNTITGAPCLTPVNGCDLRFHRSYHNGLTVSANYTYSHAIGDATDLSLEGQEGFGNADPFNLHRFETGSSDLDLRHRFVATATYEPPFGKSFTGAKKLGLDGRQVNGILVWNPGTPLSITDTSPALATRCSTASEAARHVRTKSRMPACPTEQRRIFQ
jgi:hypothetical protein